MMMMMMMITTIIIIIIIIGDNSLNKRKWNRLYYSVSGKSSNMRKMYRLC
jgi:hypothetical protein